MKENLMVICYDYALARRIAGNLAEFLDMRYFDMIDMFNFNNAPYSLIDILKINGPKYVDKKMRSVLKTELDFSGVVFVVEPKVLAKNQDLFDKLKVCNLVMFLKRDIKDDFVVREITQFKTDEEKEYFNLQLDELSENSLIFQNTLADIVVDIDNLNYEQIKDKVKQELENFAN